MDDTEAVMGMVDRSSSQIGALLDQSCAELSFQRHIVGPIVGGVLGALVYQLRWKQ